MAIAGAAAVFTFILVLSLAKAAKEADKGIERAMMLSREKHSGPGTACRTERKTPCGSSAGIKLSGNPENQDDK